MAKGSKAADLPVHAPKDMLIINLKTAKAFGRPIISEAETFDCDDSCARFAMCCVRNRACESARTGPVRLRAGSFYADAPARGGNVEVGQGRRVAVERHDGASDAVPRKHPFGRHERHQRRCLVHLRHFGDGDAGYAAAT
jgi:hypothetical protein